MNSSVFEGKKGKIHYYQKGEGKKLLVFLHGFLGYPVLFEKISKRFNPKGYLVVAPFYPGHGQSFVLPKNYSFQDLVLTIEEFIQSFNPIEVTILGHSLGGAIGWELGQRIKIPIKKTVLIDPGLGKFKNQRLDETNYFKDLKFDYPTNWLHKSITSIFHSGFNLKQLAHPFRMVFMVKSTEVNFNSFPLENNVLVLWGKNDLITPFKTYKEDLEKVKNIKYSFHDGGHHWFIAKQEEFFGELEKFI